MQEFATLLQAIASLLWPIFAFTALFFFRSQIVDIAARLKKGKLLGQEIELSDSLDQLKSAAESVQIEVAALPHISTLQKSLEDQAVDQDIARRIISEAAQSPKAALISLASELEKLARQILGTTGQINGRRYVPLKQAIGELNYGLPAHIPSSLQHFLDIRNRLIHQGEGSEQDILRAIDSGLSILRALQAMPREISVVYKLNVPIYFDSELTRPIEQVSGIILEVLSPGGVSKSFRIFPTSQTHFIQGKQVSWEWNMKLVTGEAWYRNPDTDVVELGWHSAAEFVGRHLDDI